MPLLKAVEVLPGVFQSPRNAIVHGGGQTVDERALEQPYKLQLAKVELQVGPPRFELTPVLPGPSDGRVEIPLLERGQDGIHDGEVLLELLGLKCPQIRWDIGVRYHGVGGCIGS